MITLYHGSNIAIDKIDLSKSKKGKDFGQGFYLNPNYDQAKAMAEFKTEFLAFGTPTVTVFDFDFEGAKADGLNIKTFDDYSEEWAEFVVMNRRNNTPEQIHPYDIVVGPIADDKVGLQIRLYTEGYITVEKLVKEIKYHGDKSIQYFFANERSLNYLKRK